jgi:hypothetical protein
MEAKMKHPIEDKLVMLAEFTIKPEKREAFLDYTVENLALSRTAAGNICWKRPIPIRCCFMKSGSQLKLSSPTWHGALNAAT